MAKDPAHDDAALDALVQAAMKSLDDLVPSGYFEALPNRILSRLETSMHTAPTSSDENKTMSPPASDDSGLHDIRSLAETTKKRLARKSTSQPIIDDALAASSGSFRGIALPEPARMVALPELAELPSKAEIKARDKAAKAAKAAEPEVKVAAPTAAAPVAAATAAKVAPAAVTPITAHPAAAKSRGSVYALVGVGVAAAAGIGIYVATSGGGSTPPRAPETVAVADRAAPPPPAPVAAAPIAAPTPAPVAEADHGSAAEPPAAPVTAVAVATPTGGAGKGAPATAAPAKKPGKGEGAKAAGAKPDEKVGTSGTAAPGETKAKGQPGDPSFDDLLKEAGVQDGVKKDAAPKLTKKQLTGEDIKAGMGALAGKAQSCFKGTQGTASVKLTVAPSGKVTKVTVGGAFANTPEGACVAGVAQGASFPAWDGGPQTVNYSYLLSE